MSSWRALVAGTVAGFLVVLAFLAGQLRAGGDPALRASGSTATEQTAPQTTPAPQQDFGAGPRGPDPQGTVPDGSTPDGSAPDGSTPDLAPPATHQS